MGLLGLFTRKPHERAGFALYGAAVAQARQPLFFAELGVPDTLDGRFELVALHTFLVLRRLKARGEAGNSGQSLVDLFVEDMDASVRELGASDLGVGRRVKAMAQALYADKRHSVAEICRTLGISRATLYRHVDAKAAR